MFCYIEEGLSPQKKFGGQLLAMVSKTKVVTVHYANGAQHHTRGQVNMKETSSGALHPFLMQIADEII